MSLNGEFSDTQKRLLQVYQTLALGQRSSDETDRFFVTRAAKPLSNMQ